MDAEEISLFFCFILFLESIKRKFSVVKEEGVETVNMSMWLALDFLHWGTKVLKRRRIALFSEG